MIKNNSTICAIGNALEQAIPNPTKACGSRWTNHENCITQLQLLHGLH